MTLPLPESTRDWLRRIIQFPGTGSDAKEHAQRVYDLLANPYSGVDLIAAERVRQVEVKGFDAAHDDGHANGDIAIAAAALTLYTTDAEEPVLAHRTEDYRNTWMAELVRSCKGKPDIRKLAIAGAMIAAEIDRLHRQAQLALQHDIDTAGVK